MTKEQVLIEAGRLAAEGRSYALATVVQVVRPASTKRGDRALVTPEGILSGWVGGACSEPIVIRESLAALRSGEPRLVRIGPPGSVTDTSSDVVAAESSCASEGVVEVLIEPQLPTPLLAIVGESPAAVVLADLARTIGWRVSETFTGGAEAVVVATMGHGDDDALAAALEAEIGYVGLVASSKRAATVVAALRERGLNEERVSRVRSPAGLDLGPCSQQEIAVAVLAELVAWRHARPTRSEALAEAVDPVCGMTVAVAGAKEQVVLSGVTYTFCCGGCRSRFESDPAAYLPATTS